MVHKLADWYHNMIGLLLAAALVLIIFAAIGTATKESGLLALLTILVVPLIVLFVFGPMLVLLDTRAAVREIAELMRQRQVERERERA
jgi:hypothetical protein